MEVLSYGGQVDLSCFFVICSRGAQLVLWIKQILSTHMAYLMTVRCYLFVVKECIILIMWEHKIATKGENEPHHIHLDC